MASRFAALAVAFGALASWASAWDGTPWSSTRHGVPSDFMREVLGVARGLTGARGGRMGAVVAVPGEGDLLFLGTGPCPPRGATVVVRGPWAWDESWRAGVVYGGQWRELVWTPPEGFEPAAGPAADDAPDEGTAAALADLEEASGFVERRCRDLREDWPGEPGLDVRVDACRYEGYASPAAAAGACARFRSVLERERLRAGARAMGRGPREVAGSRRFVGRTGAWRWTAASVEAPRARCVLVASGGAWILVFGGGSPPLVQAAAEAWLQQVQP